MQVFYSGFESNRRFGVEIEVNRAVSQNKLKQIIDSQLGSGNCDITGWCYSCNNNRWIVKTDSSCGDTGNVKDGGGYEIASAVGSGSKHLLNIQKVVKSLKHHKVKINKFCGLHCQVEIRDFCNTKAANLLAVWCKLEKIMAQMVPPERRNSMHCKFFTMHPDMASQWAKAKKSINVGEFWSVMKLRRLDAPAKRTAISLISFQRTNSTASDWYNFDRSTVELRFPECSLDFYDIKNWARLFVHFVESNNTTTFPSNLEHVDLQGALSLLGLGSSRDKNPIVLSAGLYETKCWLLHRLQRYSLDKTILDDVKTEIASFTSSNVRWRYEFPMLPFIPDLDNLDNSENYNEQQKLKEKTDRAKSLATLKARLLHKYKFLSEDQF